MIILLLRLRSNIVMFVGLFGGGGVGEVKVNAPPDFMNFKAL